MTIEEIRPYQDKAVTLALADGEVTICKFLFVDTEHEDIVVDILNTNKPEKYRHVDACYAVLISDVSAIQDAIETQ